MTIANASIPMGATLAPTGGTARTLVSLGSNPGENKLFLEDGSSLILRMNILATSKLPSPNASKPNGYTQQRSTLNFQRPKLLANGNYTTNSARVEISYDPESTTAEIQELLDAVGLSTVDTDFDGLWFSGSTA